MLAKSRVLTKPQKMSYSVRPSFSHERIQYCVVVDCFKYLCYVGHCCGSLWTTFTRDELGHSFALHLAYCWHGSVKTSLQFSSFQFKTKSKSIGRDIYAPSRLSDVSRCFFLWSGAVVGLIMNESARLILLTQSLPQLMHFPGWKTAHNGQQTEKCMSP